jgi:hypothetical protein
LNLSKHSQSLWACHIVAAVGPRGRVKVFCLWLPQQARKCYRTIVDVIEALQGLEPQPNLRARSECPRKATVPHSNCTGGSVNVIMDSLFTTVCICLSRRCRVHQVHLGYNCLTNTGVTVYRSCTPLHDPRRYLSWMPLSLALQVLTPCIPVTSGPLRGACLSGPPVGRGCRELSAPETGQASNYIPSA